MAQCRYYLQTLGPNVGIVYIIGSLGQGLGFVGFSSFVGVLWFARNGL